MDALSNITLDDISRYYKFAVDYGLVDVAVHPFDYADTLIRLGYEPFPPLEQSNLLRRKSLALPSISSYVYYLYMIDGLSGCFKAVVPYVTGSLIYRHLGHYILDQSPFPQTFPHGEPLISDRFTSGNLGHFVQIRAWKLVANVAAIHASHPFYVVAVRTMARFVTKEGHGPSVQESWFSELTRFREYHEFFDGCQARVIKEIMFTLISAGTFLVVMKAIQAFKRVESLQSHTIEDISEYIANSVATMYTNPFKNASDIMMINHTDIPLGNQPYNEHYDSCVDCIKRLRKDKRWKTSGSLFRRRFSGPLRETTDGQLAPSDTFFGPAYVPRNVNDIPFFLKPYYDPVLSGGADDARRRGSIALAGVKALLSDRAPTTIPGINFYYGTSPFRLAL
ncbi:Mitochondrial carrier 2 [Orchesella cincta]|uniref:Mitochondrial carrier 2 n=1 Tax=Orchesella cincta TaxID=48709 RepID=A0A1D2MPW6_ORCCI|nr:Mitochondrial carrier 2 [Orchesella cincta]